MIAPRLTEGDASQHAHLSKREMLLRPPIPSPNSLEIRVWSVFGEVAMTFAIHASKNGQSVVTVRINPAVAVDKARVLESLGWQVHVTDSAGHQFDPSDFDRLSSLADEMA